MVDPVLELVRARAAEGSVPGRRSDGHVVSLVIEGGGMRGIVSAGMCAVLEAAGLVPAFDRIYGCSAGALSGAFTAARRATLWATTFEDTASREFIDPARALRRRGPVLDMGFLFDTVIGGRKPLTAEQLVGGPAFAAVAVHADDATLRVLRDFRDTAELLAAVRGSCTVPLIGGELPRLRDEPLVDGGLLEPIPFRSALAEGSTHVLVLRTRDAAWRARARNRLAELAVRRTHPGLTPLVAAAGTLYNDAAAELEALARDRHSGVAQVAVPPSSRLVGRLSTDHGRVAESLRLGAAAMATALYGELARLMWQPVVLAPATATAG